MLNFIAPVQSNKYSLRPTFWLIAILLGLLQAGAYRYRLSTEDIISYLDIGDAYLRGDWNVAINGNWSPLYSWLLGLAIFILKPSSYWEFPVVKLVNLLIYLFALIGFEFFLHELIFNYKQKISQGSPNRSFRIPEWAWVVSGYTLFLWFSLRKTGIYCDTPDMCTAALVYFASGILLRVHTRSASWFNFIMLGVVLGFSYLSKAAMFPLSFVFLVVCMLSVGNIRRALPRILVALLAFTIISAPFIVALSTTKGHLTFSDTGKLSYAWFVNPGCCNVIRAHHWQGGPPGSGTPTHPSRKIFDDPPVYEFGTPIGGTYPPWTDPTYWYEGLTVKFNLMKQIEILWKNTIFYYKHFLGSLVFGYLILVSIGGRFWSSVKNIAENWRLLIPATAGLGIYMLSTDFQVNYYRLQPSTRFIAAFIVLLFAGVFSSVRLPDSPQSKKLIAVMTLVAFVTIGSLLSYHAFKDLGTILKGPQLIQSQVADSLKKLGQPGKKVAIIGSEYDHQGWARLARVKIVAQIPDQSRFWEKDAVVRDEVLKTIERTGARIIVDRPKSKTLDSISTTSWQEIGDTGYYAYFFRQ